MISSCLVMGWKVADHDDNYDAGSDNQLEINPLSAPTSLEQAYQTLLEPYTSLLPKERVPELHLPGLEELREGKGGGGAGAGKKIDEWEGLF